MEAIFDFFNDFAGKEISLFIVSMIPLIELRGSIILGAALGMEWPMVLGISLAGNILPIPLIILFGRKVLHFLERTKLFGKLATWYKNRILNRAEGLMKQTAVALCLFVAVPLPGTGAWSGALIAAFLDMRMRYAFPSIAIGVLIAGILMTLGSYGVVHLFS